MPAFVDLLRVLPKAEPEHSPAASVSLADPLAAWILSAQPTYSKVSVTAKTAMQVPAVALAVQTIANAVGGLPAKLYVRNGKDKEADPAYPAFTLAHVEANPWTTLPSCAPGDAQAESGSPMRLKSPRNFGAKALSVT